MLEKTDNDHDVNQYQSKERTRFSWNKNHN